MFQGVKVFDLPPVLWLPLPAVAPPTLVPKRRSEVRGAQGRGCSPQPPLRSENPQDGTPCTTPFPPCAPNPCPQTPHGSTWRPGEVGFSAAHLRSESKKRGTSARSAPVPRVFAAFGTRTSGRRRSLPPSPRPPHASSTPPTPQAPLSAPQNPPAPHPPVPASPCPRPPRAEARWGAWSSRLTRIPGNRPQQGRLR